MFHYNITVSGRVQGVSFRHAARNTARYIGVRGVIRNLYDGSVYIEAEGEKEQLSEFVRWCRTGPPFATVENVEVEEADVRNFSSFEITF
jgi:acylphosphatase